MAVDSPSSTLEDPSPQETAQNDSDWFDFEPQDFDRTEKKSEVKDKTIEEIPAANEGEATSKKDLSKTVVERNPNEIKFDNNLFDDDFFG